MMMQFNIKTALVKFKRLEKKKCYENFNLRYAIIAAAAVTYSFRKLNRDIMLT